MRIFRKVRAESSSNRRLKKEKGFERATKEVIGGGDRLGLWFSEMLDPLQNYGFFVFFFPSFVCCSKEEDLTFR